MNRTLLPVPNAEFAHLTTSEMRLLNTQMWSLGQVKVSCLEKCPQDRPVVIGFKYIKSRHPHNTHPQVCLSVPGP